jgi:hypothetical protein
MPTDPPAGDPPAEQQQGKSFTQEEVNHLISQRLAAERAKFGDIAELKRKAEAHDAAEEANRSEIERATAVIEKLQKDNAKLTHEKVRADIAGKHGLTPAQARRLVGETEEELAADAAELAKDLGIPAPGTQPPPGGGRPAPATRPVSQGAGGEPETGAKAHPMDDWMRERATATT